MHELEAIVSALAATAAEPTFLATVVAIRGSAYRRPGARLLFARDRTLAGSVSGGCLDREVLRTGAWIAGRGPVLREYDAGAEEDEAPAGSGCGGLVRLLIQPVTSDLAESLSRAANGLAAQRRVALATVTKTESSSTHAGEQMLVEADARSFTRIRDPLLARRLAEAARAALAEPRATSGPASSASLEFLLEVLEPAPQLFVFGAEEDAVPLVALAQHQGIGVTVVALRRSIAAQQRFHGWARLEFASAYHAAASLARYARPFAVVMAHDYQQDREALAALLPSSARYIGVLGPARRTERLLADCGAPALAAEPRLYAPAGLHLGAETSEAIALSIVAEVQAVAAHAHGGFLRERHAGIHDRPTAPSALAESS